MTSKMRVMTAKPLNAETPLERLRPWITANDVFFDRNQGEIPNIDTFSLKEWHLEIEGCVKQPQMFGFEEILQLPKAIEANTLECSGNGRSLLSQKARGNPWTVGGVGNAVWGGVWLKEVLDQAGLASDAGHVAFEGFDRPLGSAQIKFIRSIPIEKALSSTLLAYEMNGDPLPMNHGYPLRALAMGWAGANCVKWLSRIIVLDKPFHGFFMDKVYRKFQKGEDPAQGEVVTEIPLKSIITQPESGVNLRRGKIVILGTAYAGERSINKVEISTDGGQNWHSAELIGPNTAYAWRHWQYVWQADQPGNYLIMSRAIDALGERQPELAQWNMLGYGNNGVKEHAVTVIIGP